MHREIKKNLTTASMNKLYELGRRASGLVDLMEALQRSVGQEVAPAEAAMPVKNPRKTALGQKEMLMPIAGKKPARLRSLKSRRSGINGSRPEPEPKS